MNKSALSKLGVRFYPVLWIVSLVFAVYAGAVLYQSVYLNFRHLQEPAAVAQEQAKTVDRPALEEAATWIKSRKDYKLPELKLQTGERGRGNPFAEY